MRTAHQESSNPFGAKKNLLLITVLLVLFKFGLLPVGVQGSANNQGDIPVATRIPISPNPPPDPAHTGLVIKNFADHPLFGGSGPSKDDVFQGAAGDCYFLSELAALAGAHPDFLAQTANDLGDGTYVVHFVRGHQSADVRVNADLWVDGSGNPKYAGFGPNGPIWPAIIEKAFAACRRPPYTYKTIEGGKGETLCRLAVTEAVLHRKDCADPQEIADWVKNGAPDGSIRDAINSDALRVLLWIKTRHDAGKAIIVGSSPGISDRTPVRPPSAKKESTYHRGQHIYMVNRLETDQQGNPIGLVLRDPFGKYRTLKDFIRISFCLSDPAAIEIDPGFLPKPK